MAQPYVGGAIHLFYAFPSIVGVYGAGVGAPVYIGTGERAPRVSRRRSFRQLHNDLAGDEPFDWCYSGTSMLVTVRLTRWNEPVLQTLEDAPNTPAAALAGQNAGTELVGDVGRLMVTENAAGQLYLVYDYGLVGRAPKLAFTAGGMRPGWHFLAAFLEQDEHDGGTDPNVKPITFRCARVYNPTTGAFVIYDWNIPNLAASVN